VANRLPSLSAVGFLTFAAIGSVKLTNVNDANRTASYNSETIHDRSSDRSIQSRFSLLYVYNLYRKKYSLHIICNILC